MSTSLLTPGPSLVMEYVDGTNLEAYAQTHGALPERVALALMAQVLDALVTGPAPIPSEALCALIRACTRAEPSRRPAATTVVAELERLIVSAAGS